MPGGQYTNLKFQSQSLGLEEQWEEVKLSYAMANRVLGDIVKVSASRYGCPLVYKSGWIGALSAGLAPTINTRGALGGLAERPAVLDAPR